MWGSTFIEEEDANKIFDNMISEEYILKACDVSSVEGLTSVKLVIDTSYQSLLDLGDIVKSLETLTLDGSYISSVRDLGTGLRGLLRLSLDNCGLSELDGIGMLSNLIDLSVRDNQVSDITSLAMHETIQVGYMYIYGVYGIFLITLQYIYFFISFHCLFIPVFGSLRQSPHGYLHRGYPWLVPFAYHTHPHCQPNRASP